ncbi:hypothetical protein JO380_002269 [Cellulomonas iranensis]|uniref:Uncharacterized protein n=1 Tax=Cellulomonas iranensis TaxID=76862 RepID=A0ABU0GLD7_9CELL|nr:hypothetical protein [Cellulomonas iranensis]
MPTMLLCSGGGAVADTGAAVSVPSTTTPSTVLPARLTP